MLFSQQTINCLKWYLENEEKEHSHNAFSALLCSLCQYRCMNVMKYLPDPHISGQSNETLHSIWKLPLPDSSTYYQLTLRQYFEQIFFCFLEGRGCCRINCDWNVTRREVVYPHSCGREHRAANPGTANSNSACAGQLQSLCTFRLHNLFFPKTIRDTWYGK